MIRIPERLLDCVVYLFATESDAKDGKRGGGTGFIVSTPSVAFPDRAYAYVVTNRHLIGDPKNYCHWLRFNTGSGTDIRQLGVAAWYESKDSDIAVARLNLSSSDCRLLPVGTQFFFTPEIAAREYIGVGDEVFLLGRFAESFGAVRNAPVARFGTMAMTTTVMVKNDCVVEKFESFLCEVKSIGGLSGSPVFVHIPALCPRDNSQTMGPSKGPWLLGINWGHHHEEDKFGVKHNSGFAYVAPAWHILKVLNHPDLEKERRDDDEVMKKEDRESTATCDRVRL